MDHVTEILFQLFAILLAAKVGNEVFRRIGQPPVVGEILGGVVAGPAVLGVYQINAETELFAEIGVVLLLFQVGLETRLHDLLRVGVTALAVGGLGVILPFAGGFLAAELAGGDLAQAMFLAAALTATSVGITSNVLRDLGALSTRSGRVILGAAVIDDVLAIMILSVASGVAANSFTIESVLVLLGVALLFIVVVVVGGTRILRRRRSLLTDPEFAETPFLPGMIVMLGLAALASYIGLAAIIGAFLAGMVVGESSERHALETEVAPVAAFFTPFFFGFIGAQIDLAGLADGGALVLLAGITALAVASKFLGAYLGAIREGRDRAMLVGWGMVPRGEVGIVVAGLGLSAGAIDSLTYTVVIGMAIITTLIVPPFLPSLVRRAERPGTPATEESDEGMQADV
jgi:Kef-type K+ transport system membrane component KefB